MNRRTFLKGLLGVSALVAMSQLPGGGEPWEVADIQDEIVEGVGSHSSPIGLSDRFGALAGRAMAQKMDNDLLRLVAGAA